MTRNGLELASELLGPELALEVFACQNALLGILDVVSLFLLNHTLNTARLHHPLHVGQHPLEVPIQDLHLDPPPLLVIVRIAAQPLVWGPSWAF